MRRNHASQAESDMSAVKQLVKLRFKQGRSPHAFLIVATYSSHKNAL